LFEHGAYQAQAASQLAYDRQQAREKQAAVWLKEQGVAVRRQVALSALAAIADGVAVIGQAALLAWLLQDIIIAGKPLAALGMPLLSLLVVFFWRALCSYFASITGFEAGARVRAAVREELLEHFRSLGPGYCKQRHSGELSTVVIEQVDALAAYFARYLPQRRLVAVLPVIMIACVFPVNWVVALIFLLTGPLAVVFMALTGMGAASAKRRQFLTLSRMSGYFLDRLQGLPLLKLYGRQHDEVRNIAMTAESYRKNTMAVLRIAFLSSAVLEFFSAIAIALVAVYVGLGLLGMITFGPAAHVTLQQGLFVLLLAPEFFAPIRRLAGYYHDRAAALAATQAIQNILATQPSAGSEKALPVPGAALETPLLQLCNVGKTYGKRTVLENIDLCVGQGEKIVLAGQSGAGKTTLINLLLGFEAVTAGRIFLNGRSLTQDDAAGCIAWVGQSPHVFCGSIHDNIALADPGATDEAIALAARTAGVMEFADSLPDGLQTPVGEFGHGLSGGQVQRIALARAFLKDAPIVIFDEPTANLDRDNSIRLLQVIDVVFANRTVIIASHDDRVIRNMPRVIRLDRGRIAA